MIKKLKKSTSQSNLQKSKKKHKKPLHIDMPFEEVMKRIVRVKPFKNK